MKQLNEQHKCKEQLKEKKGFLAGALENIFGPKGLFSDKELIRFAILAAGGMLTGGSVGGSFACCWIKYTSIS